MHSSINNLKKGANSSIAALFKGPSLESQNQSTNSLLKTPQHESKGLLNTAGKHRTVKENGSYQNILAHIASRHPVRSNLATESSNWDPKAVQVRSFKDLPSVTKSAAIDETEDAGKGVSQQGDYVIPMDGSKNVDRLDPNRRASVVRTKSLKGRSNSVKRTPSRKDVDPRQSVSTESPLAPRDFTAELTRTRSKRLMSIATTFEPDKIVATDAVELTGDVSLEISRVKTMKPDVLMSPRYSFAQSSSPEASYTNLVNTRQSLQVGGSQESPIPSRASVDIKDPNAAQSEAIIESVRRASTRLSVDFGTKGFSQMKRSPSLGGVRQSMSSIRKVVEEVDEQQLQEQYANSPSLQSINASINTEITNIIPILNENGLTALTTILGLNKLDEEEASGSDVATYDRNNLNFKPQTPINDNPFKDPTPLDPESKDKEDDAGFLDILLPSDYGRKASLYLQKAMTKQATTYRARRPSLAASMAPNSSGIAVFGDIKPGSEEAREQSNDWQKNKMSNARKGGVSAISIPKVPQSYVNPSLLESEQKMKAWEAMRREMMETRGNRTVKKFRALGNVVEVLNGLRELGMDIGLVNRVDKSTLKIVIAITRWKNRTIEKRKHRNDPARRVIMSLERRLSAEIPYSIYLDLLSDAIPILMQCKEKYEKMLGPTHPITTHASRHLDGLLAKARYQGGTLVELHDHDTGKIITESSGVNIRRRSTMLSAVSNMMNRGFTGGRKRTQYGRIAPSDGFERNNTRKGTISSAARSSATSREPRSSATSRDPRSSATSRGEMHDSVLINIDGTEDSDIKAEKRESLIKYNFGQHLDAHNSAGAITKSMSKITEEPETDDVAIRIPEIVMREATRKDDVVDLIDLDF